MTLENLSVSLFLNGIGVNFKADPTLSYLVYLENKYIQQKNGHTGFPGTPGEWVQATGWFNPSGTAFFDGRNTTIGPPVNIMANSMNNALIADGSTYKLIVAVYRKTETSMQFVDVSQIVSFTAPKLYETPSQLPPVNYSPKVTANCDGTLRIVMEDKPDTVKYDIMISGPGFEGMVKVAEVPVNPVGPTVYDYPNPIPTTGQVGVTAIPYTTSGAGSPPNSTVLINGNTDPALPVYTRGLTYQYGTTATGTPCETAPATGTTATGKGSGKKK